MDDQLASYDYRAYNYRDAARARIRREVERHARAALTAAGKKAKRKIEDWWNSPSKRRKPNRTGQRLRGAKNEQTPATSAGRGRSTGGYGSSINIRSHPNKRVAKRGRRRRAKKKPLRKRVGKLERLAHEGIGRARCVNIYNGRLPESTVGKCSSPDGCYLLLHTDTDMTSTLFTGSDGLPITFTGNIDGGEPVGQGKLPMLQYKNHNHSENLTLVSHVNTFEDSFDFQEVNPFAGSSDFVGKNQKIWDNLSTFVDLMMYNDHPYPVYVETVECTPKGPQQNQPHSFAYAQNIQNSTEIGDNEGSPAANADSRYNHPDYRYLSGSLMRKHYNVKTKVHVIKGGGYYRMKFRTNCRNFNPHLANSDLAGSDRYSSRLGTKFVYFRTWGELGARTTFVDAGGAAGGIVHMPTNKIEMQIKVVNEVTYKSGGHQGCRISQWTDHRDLDGAPKVLNEPVEHNDDTLVP